MADRRTPFNLADERRTLLDFLDYLRESVLLKVEDLDDDAARHPGVPSGTNLLWLLKHLTLVERGWFQWDFAGRDLEWPTFDLLPEDTVAQWAAAYREAIAENNAIVEACDDLERLAVRATTAPEPMSLRWILVHMIEETGRHAGHADILREQLDGSVGR